MLARYKGFLILTKYILYYNMGINLGGQGMEYNGLNWNGLHGLIYLNTRSPCGGTVQKKLESLALWEKDGHCLQVGFEFLKAHVIPS